MKLDLTGIPETLFITLRIRAIETKRKDSVLKDYKAIEILKQINFDKSSKNKVSKASQTGTIVRTMIIDKIVTDFLRKYPNGVIINLGCGLDARNIRLSLKSNQWFDIDIKETIDIRKKFFEETPNNKMIDKSMFDYSWMNNISKEQPTLIISEGVMIYFEEKYVKALIKEIFNKFKFAEIAFDTISLWAVRNYKQHPDVKKYNAPFKWGIKNSNDIENWHKNIKIINKYYYTDYLKNRWPILMKIAMKVYPPFMKSFQVVHLKSY